MYNIGGHEAPSMESEWLRDAIRLSFNASIQTVPGDPKPAPPQRDPKRQKLIDGLLYSRSFILTYHLVTLGSIVIISVVLWTGKPPFDGGSEELPDYETVGRMQQVSRRYFE